MNHLPSPLALSLSKGRLFLRTAKKNGASTSSAGPVFCLASLLLLAGCGKVQTLRPAAGKSLPVKPATTPSQPQPANLLTVPTQSRPGRSDELLIRSAERPDDKFDLPPH